MAELNSYNNAEQINQLDEAAQSEQHLDPAKRLKQLSETAKAEVNRVDPNGLTDWFESVDADFVASSPLRLDFWNSTAGSKSKEIIHNTRAQVIGIMETAGINFSDGLSDQAYAPNLERIVWDEAQGSVLDMIDNTHQNGLSSLAVAEGYEKFLAEAKTKTDKEWQKRKAENQTELERMGWWRRNMYWSSPKKQFERFNPEIEKQIGVMFADIDAQTKKIKNNAKDRVDNMVERVQAVWDSTIDPADRKDLWDEIMDTAQATDLGVLHLTEFGITEDQDKIDFAEALTKLDFVKNGLGITEESENKFNQQEGLLADAQNIENTIRGYDFGKYETIATALDTAGIKSQADKSVSTEELVNILIEELNADGFNAPDGVEGLFSSMNGANLHTASSRLAVIIQNIGGAGELKSLEAKQAYMNWYGGIDTQTSGGFNRLSSSVDVQHEFDLINNGPQGPTRLLSGCITRAKALDIKNSSEGDFVDLRDKVEALAARCQRLFDQFEHKKSGFPESDRETLEKIWQKINARVDELKDVAPKWLQDKKKYITWEGQNASAIGNITQAETDLVNSLNPLSTDFNTALATPSWTGIPASLQTDITNLQTDLSSATIGSPLLNGISSRLRNLMPVISTLATNLNTAGTPNATLTALVSALNTHHSSIALKEQNFSSAQAAVNGRMSQAPTLTDTLDTIGIEAERQSIYNQVNSLITAAANPISTLPAADRFKSRLLKDFSKEVETAFLQRMEQNDQFDLLMKSAEGTSVEVKHKIVAGVQSLNFPQQLNTAPGAGDSYRVARKIANQGVLLEKVGSNETITILGPTVKGGQPYKNAIVANSAAPTSAGGANAIITNMKIA